MGEEKKSSWHHKITITNGKNNPRNTDMQRYTDVVFLDDNHILATDDAYLMEFSEPRVCCFHIDGTMVAEMPLPGYPWTVVALSQTEAVITLSKTVSKGLAWLSIDVESGEINAQNRCQYNRMPLD